MMESNLRDNRSAFRVRLIALVAAIAATLCLALPAGAAAAEDEFVDSWSAGVYEKDPDWSGVGFPTLGAFDPVAGSHPYLANTHVKVKLLGGGASEYIRNVIIDIPDGLVINPQAVPACSRADFFWREDAINPCPPETQVGMVSLPGVTGSPYKVFNMEPRPGAAAEFAFLATAVPVFVEGRVAADGSLSAVSLGNGFGNNVRAINFMFFGTPADPSHNTGSTLPDSPLVSTPTSCVGPVETKLTINSWQDSTYEHHVDETPVGGQGCEQLAFDPDTSVESSSSEAGEPTGLTFQMHVPQRNNADGRVTAHVKDVEVELPEGMKVNPSASNGLAGCTESEIDLDSTDPVNCPNGSKIGSVNVETPLLDEEVGGSVYLATPYENPTDSLLGLYIVAEHQERGVRLKIPGRVDIDEDTGQLTARFEDNPQLPYSNLKVSFNDGPKAPLMLPEECGDYELTTRISPWSAADPDNPTEDEIVEQSHTISVDSGCSEASDFDPGFSAGTESALAGQSSPFIMRATRSADDREFKTLDEIELPEGLLGHISRVDLCEADAANQGTCGEGSRIGHVVNAIGAGPRPAWIPQPGKDRTTVHLAGPYEGAPYSLSIVVPAQAGPFDLGRIVVRTPLNVDRVDSSLSTRIAESRVYDRNGRLDATYQNALPTMLEGIPLKIREIRVVVDREGFMVNPTNCREQAVTSEVVSIGGSKVDVSSRYSAHACGALGFNPRTFLRLDGRRFVRSSHPRFRATILPNPGDANIARNVVAFPKSIMLDQNNIRTVCTRPQWAADNCPDAAIYGWAVAKTPLLDERLRGPVYLRSSDNLLPDIVADLRGPVRLELAGRIDSVRGQMRTTFANVPDAPVSAFALTMTGGPQKGLLVANQNLCARGQQAIVNMIGQNRKRVSDRTRINIPRCRAQRRQVKRKLARRKLKQAVKQGRITPAQARRAQRG